MASPSVDGPAPVSLAGKVGMTDASDPKGRSGAQSERASRRNAVVKTTEAGLWIFGVIRKGASIPGKEFHLTLFVAHIDHDRRGADLDNVAAVGKTVACLMDPRLSTGLALLRDQDHRQGLPGFRDDAGKTPGGGSPSASPPVQPILGRAPRPRADAWPGWQVPAPGPLRERSARAMARSAQRERQSRSPSPR